MSNIAHYNEIFSLLDQGDLLWRVQHEPLDSGRYRVARMDNGKWLGTSSIPDPPMQNGQFIDLVKRMADILDLQIDRAGFLLAGQYVFVQLPLTSKNVVGEELTRSLNIRVQHAGQRRITMGITDRFQNNLMIHHDLRHCPSIGCTVNSLTKNVLRSIQLHEQVISTYQRMLDSEASEEMALRALFPALREGLGIRDPFHPMDHEARWIELLESDLQEELIGNDNVLGVLKGLIRYSNRSIQPDTAVIENDVVLRNRVSRYAYLYLSRWVDQQALMSYHSLS